MGASGSKHAAGAGAGGADMTDRDRLDIIHRTLRFGMTDDPIKNLSEFLDMQKSGSNEERILKGLIWQLKTVRVVLT